ncbi:MAG: ABC transporter ATP-binding protein [Microbacteriaceae bacterium]|nr:ABC transporter ATP-binding protein [Microbacteriaceae bacterium]MCL2794899.1 ABC transporter ATP-binding protein [Microbacteriaceae bacterium]
MSTPTDRPQPMLAVEGLVVKYGARTAVDGVGFAIGRGEIVGLLGPNGAGKTTTLSVIEGLRAPHAGTVTVDGVDALRHPIDARARMGVQLQSSGFQPELSIEQLLRLYAGLYGVRMSHREALDALNDTGLERESGKRLKNLSGGQQQRFSLLIASIHNPLLLLLDEPTSGLDPQSRRSLWQRIENSRRGGGSILLTTHSMEEAQAVCDRIVIIDHGKLVATGSPAELIATHRDDPRVLALAHGEPTLEDVFIALTGSDLRD